jgi:hypothetical protein
LCLEEAAPPQCEAMKEIGSGTWTRTTILSFKG